MGLSQSRPEGAVVQVVGPTDGWVLEHLARQLAAKLPSAAFVPWQPRPGGAARVAYHVNYALYQGPSGLIDAAFFTHLDESHQFLERARCMNLCVCMCRLYADWLRARGVRTVTHVPMGFDYYRYRPRLTLTVVGRLDHPRKGRHLVDRLRHLPFVEVLATEGRVPVGRLREVYERADYVLIPATVEGGPLSLLEGLAMGKPVIAPEGVGLVPELGPSEHVCLYPVGDAEALVSVVTACYQEKLRRTRLVQDRTWDHWAEAHHRLFVQLLQAQGLPPPEPASGFRFGMLGELEVPPGVEVGPLEEAVDRAAAHLFYGRHRAARSTLEQVLPSYPSVRRLLDTIPPAGGQPLPPPPVSGPSPGP